MKKKIIFYIELFIITILIHWMIVALLFYTQNNHFKEKGFFQLFYERYVECGDTTHYTYIAEHGYEAEGEKANLIVFYPLYPFLMRIVSLLIHNYFWSGILISNVCLGLSACFLYELTAEELDKKKAFDSLASYLLYPFGIFLITAFTESLFMMLSILCLLLIKKKKWFGVGITGLLASLTKTQGIVLLLPALYEAIMMMIKQKKFQAKSLFSLLIPVGTVIYFAINKIVQGSFFAFMEHEAAPPWYNEANWMANNLTQHYDMAISTMGLPWIIYWVQLFLYFLGMVALFYGIHKKISTSLIAYGGAYMFVSYMHGWLISGARYMMGCVVLYIIYASIENKTIQRILLVSEGLLAIFYTYCSVTWQAIM